MNSQEGNSSLRFYDLQQVNTLLESHKSNTNNEDDGDLGDEDDLGENGKRKRTSKVWNHFTRVTSNDSQFAEYNYCKKRLIAPSSHGTSTLKKHYDKSCKRRPSRMDIRQSLMRASKHGSGIHELKAHIFNQDNSRQELAMMVILHNYALSMVEHSGFQRFVSSLQPCFNMISRNTLKNDIIKIYDVQKIKWHTLLDKLKSRVAITSDMWTSNNTKKGFMAITAHFIDDSWILRHCILRFVYVPSPHTAEILSEVLLESMMDWNIDRKVSTLTVDNCTTNDAMIKLLLDKQSSKDFLLEGKVLRKGYCPKHQNWIVI